VCQAERQNPVKQVSSALAATALAAALSFTTVDAAMADIAGLTPCSESKAFAKRQKNEVKTLTKRLKQVSLFVHPMSGTFELPADDCPQGEGWRVLCGFAANSTPSRIIFVVNLLP
jgi:hypothetical protein